MRLFETFSMMSTQTLLKINTFHYQKIFGFAWLSHPWLMLEVSGPLTAFSVFIVIGENR